MTKQKKQEQEEARAELRKILRPGDRIQTVLRHVSRSGMSRDLDLYVVRGGELRYLTGLVARAGGWTMAQRQGLKVGGCGMDMGFAVVYDLARYLWPTGYGCIGKGRRKDGRGQCPNNDHSNGDRDYTTHRNAKPRQCPTCEGSGKVDRSLFGNTPSMVEDCRTCVGAGRLGKGHWHRDGGYALRQEWI